MEHVKREYIDPAHPHESYCKIPDGPILLDFTGCKYLGEIHLILKERFGLPDYYGENWDALWDCLRYFTDTLHPIEIYGLSTLPKSFKEEMNLMLSVLYGVSKINPKITVDIKS